MLTIRESLAEQTHFSILNQDALDVIPLSHQFTESYDTLPWQNDIKK
ncbi:hypothetical protein NG791_12725 [Laspinema sp. D1]|nr:hypothetical protein [Laspinema sp. D2b]